jgi:hypothetical protein
MTPQTPKSEPHKSPSTKLSSEYAIYKPNSRKTGGVVRFDLNRTKQALFVEAALQADENHFDWEKKITMKWGLADVGAFLATLQGAQPQAKLFHQLESSNSAAELLRRDDPQKAPYFLTISKQDKDKGVRKVSIPLTHGEAAVLEAGLRAAVVRLLGW